MIFYLIIERYLEGFTSIPFKNKKQGYVNELLETRIINFFNST